MIIPANMLTSVLVPGHISTASHHGCKGCGTCYFSAGTARACFFLFKTEIHPLEKPHRCTGLFIPTL